MSDPLDLGMDGLLAEARAATNLSDFGAPDVRPGLAVLLETYERVGLRPGGRKRTHGRIVQLLNPTAPYPVDATLDVLDLKVRVTGTVARPLDGEGLAVNVDVKAASLAALSERLKLDLPRGLPLSLVQFGPTR